MRTLAVILVFAAAARAQGAEMVAELKKKMEEISALMGQSEEALHGLANIDKLRERQEEIARRLKELEPPEQPAPPAQAEAQEKERDQLRQQQQEVVRRLQEMFDGQRQGADGSVRGLEELLRSLPRQTQRMPDPQQQRQGEEERQRRERERQEEQKRLQDKQPDNPREKKEKEDKQQELERKKEEAAERARMRHVEAWFTRLPPEMQERISRGDLSVVPQRYRQLVKEYTAARARQETEGD